ncbi:DUF6414 family protein [Paenibacillus sp. FSL K6-3166]|uniref:DUF6414 family protein n=1 Tax=unclassified Paenibacillus TaxID=185978 RepID=UPI000BA173D7|nr:DUF6414 family protein [Paenibacillus sp. VTT E-133291]OZQ78314.1 hypothetical protein CA598_29365 [Paenibacillus sp. VTT E-133291]
MNKKPINKIIYFDKETIRNILQEQHKGARTSQTGISTSTEANAEIAIEAKIKLSVPFWDRIAFLFSGKLGASFIVRRDNETTITSTEISEFEEMKNLLTEINSTLIYDIENSSTFFRVAGGYLRIVKGGVEGVDTKEFNAVMDGYDGYDTYKVDAQRYVRFNNSAFVSNYKRNDLLATRMTLFCIEVGKFHKEKFDFMKQLNKMENLLTEANQNKTLADAFPPNDIDPNGEVKITGEHHRHIPLPDILLYDVVYACIESGGE